MSADLIFRLVVAAALLFGGWCIYDAFEDRRALRELVDDQNQLIGELQERTDRLDKLTGSNNAFDAGVRAQSAQVHVVLKEARANDPEAADILSRPLPQSLRGRVFDHADPADVSDRAPEPSHAREG